MKLLSPIPNATEYHRARVDEPALRQSIASVLAEFPRPGASEDWVLDRLAQGGQAQLFVVRMLDGTPVCPPHAEVVVKLFQPNLPNVQGVIESSRESMSRLHAALNSRRIDGWTVRCPLPLHFSMQRLALVMTAVPGRSLSSLLRACGTIDTAMFHSIARAAAHALHRFWSSESRLYGDMNLHNILCDRAAGVLSFVDCGVPEPTWLCPGVASRWAPASRDLGYLLYSAASAVRASLGRPQDRQRQIWLTRLILQSSIERLAAGADREDLLSEISACAHFHEAMIERSWSPRGFWRSIVRSAAGRCIDRTITALGADESAATHDELPPPGHGVIA